MRLAGLLVLLLASSAALAQGRGPSTAAPSPQTQRGGCGEPVCDGGFELGTPNPFWDETSLNYGSPLCSADSCPFDGARSGDWWAWFGGAQDAVEVASLSQTVELPASSVADTLSFYLWVPFANTEAAFAVRLDDDVLFTATDADADLYPAYTRVALPLGPFEQDTTVTLTFAAETAAGGVTNFWVDDVAVAGTLVPNEPAAASHRPALSSVRPNPFRSEAAVDVEVDRPQRVAVEVFSLLGQRVAVLFDGVLQPGRRTLRLDGAGLAPGVYVVRLRGAGFVHTRKAVLAR